MATRTVVDRNEEGKREEAEEAAALAELRSALAELVAGQVRELAAGLLASSSARLDGRIREAVLEAGRVGLEQALDTDRSDCGAANGCATWAGSGRRRRRRWARLGGDGTLRVRGLREERASAVGAPGHRGVADADGAADGERDGFGVLLRGGGPAAVAGGRGGRKLQRTALRERPSRQRRRTDQRQVPTASPSRTKIVTVTVRDLPKRL